MGLTDGNHRMDRAPAVPLRHVRRADQLLSCLLTGREHDPALPNLLSFLAARGLPGQRHRGADPDGGLILQITFA